MVCAHGSTSSRPLLQIEVSAQLVCSWRETLTGPRADLDVILNVQIPDRTHFPAEGSHDSSAHSDTWTKLPW